MNAEGTFGAGVEAPIDDPFANTEAEFEQDDPLAGETEETTLTAAEIPVVDKEGNRVEPAGVEPAFEPAPIGQGAEAPPLSAEEEQALVDEDRRADEAVLAEAEAPKEPAVAGDSTTNGDDGTESSESGPTSAGSEATDSGASSPSGETPPALPQAQADGKQAGGEAEAEAAPPAPVTDKKGTVTHRPYVILQPEGEGKWREVSWYEDKTGKMVEKGTVGAKRQKICVARGQEDALKIGFNAVGSPKAGAKLVAVAQTYFTVHHVEPDPDPPVRQRLKIR